MEMIGNAPAPVRPQRKEHPQPALMWGASQDSGLGLAGIAPHAALQLVPVALTHHQ